MADKDMSNVFSKNLNWMLREKGMTQVDLAKRIDAAPSAVNAWVKGATIPRTPTLRKIMEVLGCELDDLMVNRYPANAQDDLTKYIGMLRTRPECRTLLLQIKDAKKEDVEKLTDIAKVLIPAEGK